MASAPAEAGADSAAVDAAATLAPVRCTAGGEAFALGDDVEIGDAIAYPNGYAVGIVRRSAGARVAAVAMLGADATSANVVDLGPTPGDAPPPRLAWRPKDLVAAAYSIGAASTRDLALYAVNQSKLPFATVPQQRDDSFAFDVAYASSDGLVAWDEATTGPSARGVVRVASIVGGTRGPIRDASPPESDAESPRVAAIDGAFEVLWIARRDEPAGATDASTDEVTGEPRSFGWIEAVTIDAHGNTSNSTGVRKLTPGNGHVTAFDVQPLADGKTLLVVARDDGEAVDGSGGALLRVRATKDAFEPPVGFSTDGLGRGAPAFVDPGFWLTWVGPHEQLRLLPLDATGAPVALPSREEALDDARPLLSLGHTPPVGARTLVATPGDAAAQLRVFSCVQ